jgi:hypothetical protein
MRPDRHCGYAIRHHGGQTLRKGDLPMAYPMPDTDLHDRLDQLAARLVQVKAALAQGVAGDSAEHARALRAILHRHGEIAMRARSAGQAPPRRRAEIAAELAADIKGLEEALRGWVARLDERHRETPTGASASPAR